MSEIPFEMRPPFPIAKELLGALGVKLPQMLPRSKVEVGTKKKLHLRRKK